MASNNSINNQNGSLSLLTSCTTNAIFYGVSTNTMGSIGSTTNGVLQYDGSGAPTASTPTVYTPTIGDGTRNFTMTTQAGYYWLIGRYYWVNIQIIWSNINSASGAARISLPATTGTSPSRTVFTLGYVSNITVGAQMIFNANPGVSYISGWVVNTGGGVPTALPCNAFSNSGGEIQLAGWMSS